MKTYNKGYTLTELLLAIAIFSIIMVSIVALMNSVSVSYKNENFEVNVQEDAQILVAQVEELLVDAKDFSKSGNTYTVSLVGGSSESIVYDDIAKQVKLTSGGTTEVLASNVSSFSIEGFAKTSTSIQGDNRVVVKASVAMKTNPNDPGSSEYSYSATKDVMFRNDVENDPVRSGAFLDNSTGSTEDSSSGGKSLTVGRYQVVNLEEEFGITIIESITDASNAYEFLKEADFPGSITSIGHAGSRYLTTTDTCNLDINTTYSATIVGKKNATSDSITVIVTTLPVSIKKGSGILEYGLINVNGKGMNSYINIEGIDLPDLQTYFGTQVNASIEIVDKSMSGNLGPSTSTDKWSSSRQWQTSDGVPTRIGNICLYYDCYDPTKIIFRVYNGDPSGDSTSVWHPEIPPYGQNVTTITNCSKFDSNDIEVKISLDIPSGHGTSGVITTTEKSQTFRLYNNGSKLNGYSF